ncbi:MAG: 4Fe-4S dicluster domain-containing protein [Candidatus Cloacimonadaceae bacterium]|nr:4Fe-4S dicluster domain-containing protein [Candidatus Cloacimonadaceae bacterium]MDP3113442.1 4Fe-4S dicluster domain-containing protein [Candidatus Cloacimonadaceae bacterium]
MKVYRVTEKKWTEYVAEILKEFKVFAPVKKENSTDFEEITVEKIGSIYYEGTTPSTPLKAFFFPVKENVVATEQKQARVILGVSNCDLAALDLLDNIYLGGDFMDHCYKENRDHTIIFGKDCDDLKETCHCTSYGLTPYCEKNCDISMSVSDGYCYLSPLSEKGETFLGQFKINDNEVFDCLPEKVIQKRTAMAANLQSQNINIPDEKASRKGIEKENKELWKRHASTCVSCGACSMICPTCHCFLLIDLKDFEKVKNWDACQFAGFSRVAAGEDPLMKLYDRLKFRYLCKFVYKPDMFNALACTGCGRCIDACIGKINKNEVIVEACGQG